MKYFTYKANLVRTCLTAVCVYSGVSCGVGMEDNNHNLSQINNFGMPYTRLEGIDINNNNTDNNNTNNNNRPIFNSRHRIDGNNNSFAWQLNNSNLMNNGRLGNVTFVEPGNRININDTNTELEKIKEEIKNKGTDDLIKMGEDVVNKQNQDELKNIIPELRSLFDSVEKMTCDDLYKQVMAAIDQNRLKYKEKEYDKGGWAAIGAKPGFYSSGTSYDYKRFNVQSYLNARANYRQEDGVDATEGQIDFSSSFSALGCVITEAFYYVAYMTNKYGTKAEDIIEQQDCIDEFRMYVQSRSSDIFSGSERSAKHLNGLRAFCAVIQLFLDKNANVSDVLEANDELVMSNEDWENIFKTKKDVLPLTESDKRKNIQADEVDFTTDCDVLDIKQFLTACDAVAIISDLLEKLKAGISGENNNNSTGIDVNSSLGKVTNIRNKYLEQKKAKEFLDERRIISEYLLKCAIDEAVQITDYSEFSDCYDDLHKGFRKIAPLSAKNIDCFADSDILMAAIINHDSNDNRIDAFPEIQYLNNREKRELVEKAKEAFEKSWMTNDNDVIDLYANNKKYCNGTVCVKPTYPSYNGDSDINKFSVLAYKIPVEMPKCPHILGISFDNRFVPCVNIKSKELVINDPNNTLDVEFILEALKDGHIDDITNLLCTNNDNFDEIVKLIDGILTISKQDVKTFSDKEIEEWAKQIAQFFSGEKFATEKELKEMKTKYEAINGKYKEKEEEDKEIEENLLDVTALNIPDPNESVARSGGYDNQSERIKKISGLKQDREKLKKINRSVKTLNDDLQLVNDPNITAKKFMEAANNEIKNLRAKEAEMEAQKNANDIANEEINKLKAELNKLKREIEAQRNNNKIDDPKKEAELAYFKRKMAIPFDPKSTEPIEREITFAKLQNGEVAKWLANNDEFKKFKIEFAEYDSDTEKFKKVNEDDKTSGVFLNPGTFPNSVQVSVDKTRGVRDFLSDLIEFVYDNINGDFKDKTFGDIMKMLEVDAYVICGGSTQLVDMGATKNFLENKNMTELKSVLQDSEVILVPEGTNKDIFNNKYLAAVQFDNNPEQRVFNNRFYAVGGGILKQEAVVEIVVDRDNN